MSSRPSARDAGRLPLHGLRVWNTRPEGPEAEAWNVAFRAAGALVVHIPTARVACPARDTAALDDALARLAVAAAEGRAAHLMLTSSRGAAAAAARLAARGVPAGALAGVRVWCVGPRTSAAWRACAHAAGTRVEEGAAGRDELVARLAAALGDEAGRSRATAAAPVPALVVWPRSSLAPAAALEPLAKAGAATLAPVAYETVAGPENPEGARQLIEAGDADAVVFASPSAVVGLAACLDGPPAAGRLPAVVCVGETTAEACRDVGLPVAGVAGAPTAEAVVLALRNLRAGR